MKTPIYLSRKLEKSVKKLIVPEQVVQIGLLGKWNATLFYMDRKKCWLLSNSKTQYSVVLIDITSKKLLSISELFLKAFYAQLIHDGIKINLQTVNDIIGQLQFLPTDNDRKTTGFQNHRLYYLTLWKEQYGNLENMPIRELTGRMNGLPIHIGESKKMSDYTDSIAEIKMLLESI